MACKKFPTTVRGSSKNAVKALKVIEISTW